MAGRTYLTDQDVLVSASNPAGAGYNVYIAGVGASDSSGSGALPVSGTVEAEFLSPVDVAFVPGQASNITQISSTTGSTLFVGANLSRKMLVIMNDSTASLYVKLGTSATTASFTYKIAAGAYIEMGSGWIGDISGFWSAVNGSALVTEIV